MTLQQRLADRFARRLQEGDDAIGFWGWFALVVVVLMGLGVFLGILLALSQFDNVLTSLVSLALGLVLLTATSPGWAATLAVRRHRKRLAQRLQAQGDRRSLLEQLYALGRVDEATYKAQSARLHAFLQGIGPGDAPRVASSWARMVGTLALLTGLGLNGFAASFAVADGDPFLMQTVVLPGATVATALIVAGVVLVVAAMALAARARREHHAVHEAIESAHAALLEAARA